MKTYAYVFGDKAALIMRPLHVPFSEEILELKPREYAHQICRLADAAHASVSPASFIQDFRGDARSVKSLSAVGPVHWGGFQFLMVNSPAREYLPALPASIDRNHLYARLEIGGGERTTVSVFTPWAGCTVTPLISPDPDGPVIKTLYRLLLK